MANDYRSMVTAMLQRLGLPATALDAEDGLVLGWDDLDIRVTDDPLGRHVVVSAIAGSLAASPERRRELLSAVLDLNLGCIMRYGLGAALDRGNGSDVVVTATIEYHRPVDQLIRLVEDVGTVARLHKDLFDVPKPSASAYEAALFENALIFQP